MTMSQVYREEGRSGRLSLHIFAIRNVSFKLNQLFKNSLLEMFINITQLKVQYFPPLFSTTYLNQQTFLQLNRIICALQKLF